MILDNIFILKKSDKTGQFTMTYHGRQSEIGKSIKKITIKKIKIISFYKLT